MVIAHRHLAPIIVGLLVAGGIASGCGFGSRTLSSDLLGSNGDDGIASLGHERPADGIVSFSYPLVWNLSDRPLTLVDATIVDPFGNVETLGALVGDHRREYHAADAYDSFPEDVSGAYPPESLHELSGYVLEPVADPDAPGQRDRSESVSVIVGLQVGAGDLPSGVLGVCVRFRDDEGSEGEKCIDHQLVICETLDPCPIGAQLEDLLRAKEDA